MAGMNLLARLETTFTALDTLALILLILAWYGTGWLAEHPPRGRPSVSLLMQTYRRRWMQEFLTRQPRIFDASVIDNLRQGTAFFASTSVIAIGGGVAMISNAALLQGLAADFTIGAEVTQIRVKMLVVLAYLANALLKFIWSNRLFGYCAIMMAAVPNDATDPMAPLRGQRAAAVNITAARSFDRGLHSIYFALAALCWLVGPRALIAAALVTAAVLMRREFASQSRAIMLADQD